MNPEKASTRGTQTVTHLEEDKVFTAAEVAMAIKEIKSKKLILMKMKKLDEDEIRPEMLKALTREGILCITRKCQVTILLNTCDLVKIDLVKHV